MTHTEIVPATSEHVRELALTMRQDDRREVYAQSGIHHALGLGLSFGMSVKAWTGLADGKVVCIWGVSEGDDGVGVPWLLGSDLVSQYRRRFIQGCRAAVEEMHDLFPVLENHVDSRNTLSIRWLRWLGFEVFPTVPFGPYNMPFHPFRRVRM